MLKRINEINKEIKETKKKIKKAEKDVKDSEVSIRNEKRKHRREYEDDEEQQDNIDHLTRTLQDEVYILGDLRYKLEELVRDRDTAEDEIEYHLE